MATSGSSIPEPAAEPTGGRGTIQGHAGNSFTVTGPGKKDRETLPVDDGRGIEVACEVGAGGFVYELKVPLAANRGSTARRRRTGSTIVLRVTIDTPQVDRGGDAGADGRRPKSG